MTPRFLSKDPAPPSPLLARRPSHKEDEQIGSTRPTTHRHAHPIATDAVARALAHVTATQASTQPVHVQRPDTRATQQPQQGIQHPRSPTSPAQVSHTAQRAAHARGELHRVGQPGALSLAGHLREHERGRTLRLVCARPLWRKTPARSRPHWSSRGAARTALEKRWTALRVSRARTRGRATLCADADARRGGRPFKGALRG